MPETKASLNFYRVGIQIAGKTLLFHTASPCFRRFQCVSMCFPIDHEPFVCMELMGWMRGQPCDIDQIRSRLKRLGSYL